MSVKQDLIDKYIPKDERKKILLISDDIRAHSGVGTIGKEIVLQTSHHFNWVQIAGATNHPEKGNILDLSGAGNQARKIEDASIFLYPRSGYGDAGFLRALIRKEQPDALFIITDPRYFTWLFQIESEIRSKIPIIYLNIWDNLPLPYYNKSYYESCDLLLGISKQTKYINNKVLGEDKGDIITKYVPHGLDPGEFFPLQGDEKEYLEFKKSLFKNQNPEFVAFFNSRNIRRKQIPDVIWAWKMFLDMLSPEKCGDCKLILHTDPISDHGTDLFAVAQMILGDKYPDSYLFSTEVISRKELNFLYNVADVQILISSNEGWGLSLTEALLSGTPIIANTTGGMQDQMGFKDQNKDWYTPSDECPSNNTGTFKTWGEWAFPVFPSNISIQGSPLTPYIFDDRCNPKDVAQQLLIVQSIPRDKRKKLGLKGREFAMSSEVGFTNHHQALRIINNVDDLLENFVPKKDFDIIKANDYKFDNYNNLTY